MKQSLEQWLDGFELAPDAFELGEDLFDQGAAAEPPADLIRRRIWERVHEKCSPG